MRLQRQGRRVLIMLSLQSKASRSPITSSATTAVRSGPVTMRSNTSACPSLRSCAGWVMASCIPGSCTTPCTAAGLRRSISSRTWRCHMVRQRRSLWTLCSGRVE
ncbi:hypothetical protein EMCG_08858 [[Emmonsia] crescens]|uniref:Uncharacterized protein n=1 Tax=[Emmonsia] crescens TaxID=73230 RepID=A0A0G2I3S8_9EURO|nr:hypothetical protein EMCG_08858 [Emmonsia crescens UAMH 3008]